jgi:hypothetical protein
MAFVDWADNTSISSWAPSQYWPEMSSRLSGERLKLHCYWHALPVGWDQLTYEDFLNKRRHLIAPVVSDAFQTLLPHFGIHGGPDRHSDSNRELIAAGESLNVEFKSSARWTYKGQVRDPKLEHVIVKTIAGLMNATIAVISEAASTMSSIRSSVRLTDRSPRRGWLGRVP